VKYLKEGMSVQCNNKKYNVEIISPKLHTYRYNAYVLKYATCEAGFDCNQYF
jgi:hypothetical protein